MTPRTHCKNGHKYTPDTTAIRYRTLADGETRRAYRRCRTCAQLTDGRRAKASDNIPPQPILPGDPEVWHRVRVLALEGVPANWIAEDVGWTQERVWRLARKKGWGGSGKEWGRAWSRIRTHDDLYALHLAFAPKKTDYRPQADARSAGRKTKESA